MGVVNYPQVSQAQCNIPEIQSTKNCAMINPRTTVIGFD